MDELLEWVGSHACTVELEACWRMAECDYRQRWGRAPGLLQRADWMLARLLEEARALDIRGRALQDLLFRWPRQALPRVTEELEALAQSGQCARLSVVVAGRFAEALRTLMPAP